MVEKIAIYWWRLKRALRREAVVIKGAVGSGRFELDFEDPLSMPVGEEQDRIDQLKRLQRARKGKHLPAPVSVQLSSDH